MNGSDKVISVKSVPVMDDHDYINGGKMGQLEELKAFISEGLKAIASEILGAVDKTVTEYEEEACRLKEENNRHCSVLDLLIKGSNSPLRKDGVPEENPSMRGENLQSPHRKAAAQILTTRFQNCGADVLTSQQYPGPDPNISSLPLSDMEGTFPSYTDFLTFARGNKNCPYCLKAVPATELHLKRHYSFAVHFSENGIGRFVVPCACKDLIQGRSHWHCPYCKKILTRRITFKKHISNMHGYPIHHPNQEAERDLPFSFVSEKDVASTSDVWCQKVFVFRDQDGQKFSILPVKTEQAHHSGEQGLGAYRGQDSALNILCVDTSTQQYNELEIPSSGLKALRSRKKQLGKKPLSLNGKRKPPIQNDTGAYTCQVCGKTFHYIYTLKSHVWTHLRNGSLCGICGKLETNNTESSLRHLESHMVRKKCGLCGKQFSSAAQLKNHWQVHRGNPQDVMSLS